MSGNIEYFAVAVTTALPGHYLALHLHRYIDRVAWTPADTEAFLRLQDMPERLLMNEAGVDEWVALARTTPVLIRLWTHRIVKNVTLIGPGYSPDVISRLGESQIRRALIAKGVDTLQLTPEAAAHAGCSETLKTLDQRGDLDVIDKLAWYEGKVTTEGSWKVVSFPANLDVRLSRNANGEFIREVPRVWA